VDLTTIDGISVGVASVLLSEIGVNRERFPDEHHFASWARLCPRNPSSAGKIVRKKRHGTGANRVNQALRHAAVSLKHADCALGAEYRRTAARRGAGVAVFAVARQLAKFVFRMLRYGQAYVDIGVEQQFATRRLANFLRQADEFGFDIVPKVKTA
jgi:transposase